MKRRCLATLFLLLAGLPSLAGAQALISPGIYLPSLVTTGTGSFNGNVTLRSGDPIGFSSSATDATVAMPRPS